jgi:hypothetical protein
MILLLLQPNNELEVCGANASKLLCRNLKLCRSETMIGFIEVYLEVAIIFRVNNRLTLGPKAVQVIRNILPENGLSTEQATIATTSEASCGV